MTQKKELLPFMLIAAKGNLNGTFRIWYGSGENDQSPFVLTLTSQHVARALHKTLPITLEEIEQYVQTDRDRLESIARSARLCGQKAKILV
jgi:hypothetical protein